MRYCYSCFNKVAETMHICPYCGREEIIQPQQQTYLFPGSMLNGRYIIGEAIGSGGFGIIYKAWDRKLETIVAVKEFYPSRIVNRAPGENSIIIFRKDSSEFEYRKKRFLAEARTMARYGSHRNIVNVFEFFEENQTAYIVMELLQGTDLREYLKSHGGKLNPDFAIMIANEVGSAVKMIHADGIIHRDISPDNIYICSGKDIKIKLLDFGAAKLTDETDDVVDIILKPGYTPPEQYDNTKNVGEWSDVYALGATLYEMITGIKPDESTNRKTEDTVVDAIELNSQISKNLNNAIMKSIALDIHMRFHTIDEFLEAIRGERKVDTLKNERTKKRIKRLIGIGAALITIAILFIILDRDYQKKKEVEVLKDANIEVWFSVKPGSSEKEAVLAVTQDFQITFPNVEVICKAFSEEEYKEAILEASKTNQLPDIFESTDLSDDLLETARDIVHVLDTEQAGECLFLDQYETYYKDKKRLPLAFIVPTAYVIVSGATSITYDSDYFERISDFNTASIAVDPAAKDLIIRNYGSWGWLDKSYFMDNNNNTVAVYLSTTLSNQEVRETLTNYQKKYVYPSADEIYCSFTYEWSLGKGSHAEEAAADRLLSWMMGNVYQDMLMVSRANDGQLPLNKTCFLEKCENRTLKPLSDKKIYSHFVFKKD